MCSGNVNGKKIHLVFWIHWVYLHYCLDFYNLPPLNVLTSQTKFECLLSVLSHHYVLIQEVSSAVRGIILFANGDPGSIFGNFMKCIFVLDPRHGHVLYLKWDNNVNSDNLTFSEPKCNALKHRVAAWFS